MPTLLQFAARTFVIWLLTVVASLYGAVYLLLSYWHAYRRLPEGASICDLFRQRLHRRPTILDDSTWQHGFLQLSEIRMHYVKTGGDDDSKPLMICLHGFPQYWYSYRFQLRHFARDYRVVALDMRGYGESDKPTGVQHYDADIIARDIIEAIEKLGGRTVLLGHDWGGVISWHIAIRRPDLISQLVIMNAAHPKAYLKVVRTNACQLLKSWYMFLFQCPWLAEHFLMALDFTFMRNSFYSKESGLINSGNLTADDIAAWEYTFSQSGAFTPPLNYYRAAARTAGSLHYTAELVHPKTLIIWGDRDVALEPQCAELSAVLCRKAHVERIPNASHWVQEDVPELVNRAIEAFLQKNDYND